MLKRAPVASGHTRARRSISRSTARRLWRP
jgi:hypothetical protein